MIPRPNESKALIKNISYDSKHKFQGRKCS